MKHFVDIKVAQYTDITVTDTCTIKTNTGAFVKGDIISITEKVDGANASICYNVEEDKLDAFSRKNLLDFSNQLRGFYGFAMEQNKEVFKKHANWVVFGEWLVSHTIKYNADSYNHWYVYSIWDKEKSEWLTPDIVKAFCEEATLEYVHELYYGPFISWEHCESFMNSPYYGDRQEGIVVRNISKQSLGEDNRLPYILKLVNKSFKESHKTHEHIVDPIKEGEKAKANKLIASIVTEARVRKEIHKLVDEGILPTEIEPEHMKIVAQNLPKRIYDDCIKEEKEIVVECGEYAGKFIGSRTMLLAKHIILGI